MVNHENDDPINFRLQLTRIGFGRTTKLPRILGQHVLQRLYQAAKISCARHGRRSESEKRSGSVNITSLSIFAF
ncbi:hypothetical protein DAI22_04g095266 [Oryza sativa Japonica Group]|nr:hypothetical protein DAI22_04g095266 [Oryza sativa Japonica Group]